MSKFVYLSGQPMPEPGPRQITGEELFGNLSSLAASGATHDTIEEYLAELRRLGHLDDFDRTEEPAKVGCSSGRFVRARRPGVLGIDYDPGSVRDVQVRGGQPYICHHVLDTQTGLHALAADEVHSQRMIDRLESNTEQELGRYRWHRTQLPYTWREDIEIL